MILLLALNALLPGVPNAYAKHAPHNRCAELLQLELQELVSPRPGFEHNTDYSIRVATTPIRDQCDYGGCWVYGTLANMEDLILAQTGEKMDLSEQYVILESLHVRAHDALVTPGQTVIEGGHPMIAQWLVDRFGIVPSSVWKPRIPFEDSPASRRLMYFLNSRIAEYHVDAARATSEVSRTRLLKKARKDVKDIIEAFSGPLPKKFKFQGRMYTPNQFAAEKLPTRGTRIVRVLRTVEPLPGELNQLAEKAMQRPELPFKSAIHSDYVDMEGSPEQIEKAIVSELKAGRSVPVSLEVVSAFVDNDTGVMSMHAFHLPEGFRPPPARYRHAFGPQGGGHVVEIVGADLDQGGRVRKFLVKNSWGKFAGDRGFYHMYRDYFDEFMQAAYFRQEASAP